MYSRTRKAATVALSGATFLTFAFGVFGPREQRRLEIIEQQQQDTYPLIAPVSTVYATTPTSINIGDPLACIEPECVPVQYWDGEEFHALPETR